jgi:putative ABC transport system substrate-binding protein
MKRRQFITLLGGAAAWPLAARAQQPAMPVIGYLSGDAPSAGTDGNLADFRRGLSEAGYVEGRNAKLEYRAAGDYDRLRALADDLVGRRVAVIVTSAPAAALAAKAATTTIPVVFRVAGDPIRLELVASLNRPGGNLTGVTALGVEVGPKRLELMHELVPAATTIGVLAGPTGRPAGQGDPESAARALESAARTLGLKPQYLTASTEGDLDAAFASMERLNVGGLVISVNPFFVSRMEELARPTVRHAVPAIFQYRDFAAAGGLMSYGGNVAEAYRQVGIYTGRILKGEKPADLPVERSTKVELFVNLKTAKALGLTVPLALLTRADEVIE